MKLKTDDAGHAVVVDGKPVYLYEDGREIPFDAAATVATISRINGEAKSQREKREAADAALKAFDGLDPVAARKALELTANLDAKKLIDAGEVEKVKAETAKAYEDKLKALHEQFKPVVEERDTLHNKLIERTIGSAFNGSKFIADKLAIPADLVQAAFGRAFKVEGEKVVAYASNGEKIYSRERPGEVAGFDEALSMLVETYPKRDMILKGPGASGSGARGSGGGAGSKEMKRGAFEALSPQGRMAHIKAGGSVVD